MQLGRQLCQNNSQHHFRQIETVVYNSPICGLAITLSHPQFCRALFLLRLRHSVSALQAATAVDPSHPDKGTSIQSYSTTVLLHHNRQDQSLFCLRPSPQNIFVYRKLKINASEVQEYYNLIKILDCNFLIKKKNSSLFMITV